MRYTSFLDLKGKKNGCFIFNCKVYINYVNMDIEICFYVISIYIYIERERESSILIMTKRFTDLHNFSY